jgi:hypothetical protein
MSAAETMSRRAAQAGAIQGAGHPVVSRSFRTGFENQAPSSKFKAQEKLQAPNAKFQRGLLTAPVGTWSLVFGSCFEL